MKTTEAIASKSDAHRALISAGLSDSPCRVLYNTTSEDIEATKKCMEALKKRKKEMYCGESGSTLRFLLPVMGALGYDADFYPEGRLPDRPLSPLYEEMERMGCRLGKPGSVPFSVRGKLKAGTYTLPGNVSSQFITGLLFALPCLEGDSRIVIKGNLQSQDYVRMTLYTLKQFGINIIEEKDGYQIKGKQKYKGPDTYIVEGDWSNSCFFLVAGAIGEETVEVTGLNRESVQGDKEILSVLKAFGAEVRSEDNAIQVSKKSLKGIKVNAEQIPDMVPAITALACAATGKTIITGAGRLRIKESDRLKSITEVVKKLGGDIEELEEGLIITGHGKLKGGCVSSHGDHRIAMMAAIMSLICEEKVVITGSEAVNKSYPGFFKELEKLHLDGNIERK